jgi:hypothetical protein
MNIKSTCVCGGSPSRPNDDCERCQLVAFILLVGEMRAAQDRFFRHRSGDNLQAAKQLEASVDRRFADMTNQQENLF